jgi:hypothetical protein
MVKERDCMFEMFNEINYLEDLTYALFKEIGLGINEYGFVYDQDTGNVLTYEGKQVKASVDPNHPALANDVYAIFDPVFDNKFMMMMLGYYLKKEEAMGNLDPLSFSEQVADVPQYNQNNPVKSRKTRITVICSNRVEYNSAYYYQKGLKYSDIILRIGKHPGCNCLWKFDSVPEETIQQTQMAVIVKPTPSKLINYGGTAEDNINKINKVDAINSGKNIWQSDNDEVTIDYWDM